MWQGAAFGRLFVCVGVRVLGCMLLAEEERLVVLGRIDVCQAPCGFWTAEWGALVGVQPCSPVTLGVCRVLFFPVLHVRARKLNTAAAAGAGGASFLGLRASCCHAASAPCVHSLTLSRSPAETCHPGGCNTAHGGGADGGREGAAAGHI